MENLTHEESSRLNIPTAEYQTQASNDAVAAVRVAYERLNRDLDPQLVWRGKDIADWSDLVVQAPPLFIQEKIQPKALVEDLRRLSQRRSIEQAASEAGFQIELFSDFNGLPSTDVRTEFYRHQMNWSNRMILGDSLQVMASLAESEGLRGQVQCIYIDPPYGIKFNSNFQWSTTSRDVRDGKADHITREPEQVRAFRDTWRDGIHSYLTYLRDRLTVARDLLTESGSIFVQIGDENVHRVRTLMDEVFGASAFIAQVTFRVKSPLGNSELARTSNFILWYARNSDSVKFRELRALKQLDEHSEFSLVQLSDGRVASRAKLNPAELTDSVRYLTAQNLGSSGYTDSCMFDFSIEGRTFSHPRGKSWKTNESGMRRLLYADRLHPLNRSLRWRYYLDDAPGEAITDVWQDTFAAYDKTYVVQTATSVIERCLLMTTDPGDLVLDPTCGAGTAAYVAEQWGRRWITIDTSRVALALARARLMGARYPHYLLSDSPEGRQKEADLGHAQSSDALTYGDVRQGFVYERVPHITLRSIANNAELDVIYEQRQPAVEAALADLNSLLRASPPVPFEVELGGRKGQRICFASPADATVSLPSGEEAPASGLLEWEVPRERPGDWPADAAEPHERFWQARLDRQQAMDESIAAKADFEDLYDKPYEDSSKVRVAGPFTVESISPHRYLGLGADDELIDPVAEARSNGEAPQDFVSLILDNLRTAGVQQAHKADRIDFTSLQPWPGDYVCAAGAYTEASATSPTGSPENGQPAPDAAAAQAETRTAAIFVGPEFGTVTRPELVAASREATEAGFDVLIACAFNYDAQASAFIKSGPLPVLKARMNADLHMASELKSTGSGNLFVIFGEPDIELLQAPATDDGAEQFCVKLKGIDVFDPTTGDVRSDEPDSIACWFVDTDYDHESFFVRHAYFLGSKDPYETLKRTLRAEIDEDAWASLHSDISRPFPAPESGHIAVKVINHLGDEVMKVFRLPSAA
ncbi:site-specific DNA-methyltransferase [Candidatus Poriferisodalis sp.]|uniref:site-specific DNA-methyltransferase n=1 Tax=Candidatus Poriferisodalis sp. TaxID=3101277 RepID=UPI003D12AFAF